MFLDIDHIAISSSNYESDSTLLKQLGYNEVFREFNIDNPKIKSELMKNYSEQQNLVLLKLHNNLGVEFVIHKTTNATNPYIIPILENVSQQLCESIKEITVNNLILNKKIKSIDSPMFVVNNEKNDFQFTKILIKTKNVVASANFLKLFGCKPITQTDDLSIVEFNSLLSGSVFRILIQKDDSAVDKHYLDDYGCNCIAFISSSAEKDRKSLAERGLFVTQIEKLHLNDKSLQVFFCQSDHGDIVEIISIDN